LYVDSRCVTNQKPLLESGTLSTKGHVQVIVPFITETYGSKADPPEKDTPYCTLKSFPSSIEHCIQWARDFSFESLFANKPNTWNSLFDEPNVVEKIPSIPIAKLRDLLIISKLIKKIPRNFDDCIHWGRIKFESYYKNSMLQLIHSFPLDHKLKDGTPFWASPKRPPTPLEFNPKDQAHVAFVVSAAALWAINWGISLPKPRKELFDDHVFIAKVTSTTTLPKFIPKNKKIETDENAKKPNAEAEPVVASADEEFARVKDEIIKFIKAGHKHKLSVADFEKDDDSNFHIDFISATANLRARVYSIPESERLAIKRIAGRIIPAIATTTAAVSGWVSTELIKLIKKLPIESYKNVFMNLGISYFMPSEPGLAPKTKLVGDKTFTLWDRWDVKEGDITLGEFKDFLEKTHGVKVTGVFQDTSMVYVPLFGHNSRLPTKLQKLLNAPVNGKYVDLIVTVADESGGEDRNAPTARFFLPGKKKVLKKK